MRARLVAPFVDRLGRSAAGRCVALSGPHARPWRMPTGEVAHEVAAIASARAYQDTLLWAGMLDVPTGLRRIRCRTRIAFGALDVLLGAVTARGTRRSSPVPSWWR